MPSKKKSSRQPSPKPKGRRLGKRKTGSPWAKQLTAALLGLGSLVLVVILAGYFAHHFFTETPGVTEPPETVHEKTSSPALKFEIYPKETRKEPKQAESIPPVVLTPDGLPLVCIIIDDMGYDRKLAGRFLSLGMPITFSMLPFSPFQEEIITTASSKHAELMLHLPMEPEEYPRVDPGPGALLTTMTPDALIRQLTRDIRSIPGVTGVNNHMGSKMTAVSSQMYQIFTILKKEGLFFVDSRTTVNTLCKPSARLLQVPFAERDIFLDHEATAVFVRKQIGELILRAEKEGEAIGIGHPHLVTYEVLKEMLPELQKRVRLVPASQLVALLG